MSDTLIKVENVSKKFSRDLKRSLWYGLKDIGRELLTGTIRNGELRNTEFWSVKNVNFELKRGQCLGLIGHNGAGKTTLLRMLNGLLYPDTGKIEINGTVAALIALGATIRPILTGRENIYINAALRGLSKRETDSKLEEIIDFSGLEDFIDSPVQNYSSGMTVRLNFAVASSLNPDILLLDEVLAVGDANFRNKCYHRIASLRKKAAVIFVSHNMEQIARISDEVLILNNGNPIHYVDVADGISSYNQLAEKDSNSTDTEAFLSIIPPIIHFDAFLDKNILNSGDSLNINITVKSSQFINNFLFKVHFYNDSGSFSADGVFTSQELNIEISEGETFFTIPLHSIPLKNGKYKLAFNIIDSFGDILVWSYKRLTISIIGAYSGAISDCQLKLAS